MDDEFFIVYQGVAEARRGNDVPTGERYGPGTCFGERALLAAAVRNTTVVAAKHLEVFVLEREVFEGLGLRSKLNFPHRENVATAHAPEVWPSAARTPWPASWTSRRRASSRASSARRS